MLLHKKQQSTNRQRTGFTLYCSTPNGVFDYFLGDN